MADTKPPPLSPRGGLLLVSRPSRIAKRRIGTHIITACHPAGVNVGPLLRFSFNAWFCNSLITPKGPYPNQSRANGTAQNMVKYYLGTYLYWGCGNFDNAMFHVLLKCNDGWNIQQYLPTEEKYCTYKL